MAIFDRADSLGNKSNGDIATYLTEINDLQTAQEFVQAQVGGQGAIFPTKAWKHTGASIGFIDFSTPAVNGIHTIKRASAIQADTSLIGQSIKVTLDHFYVHNYPGLGTHNVLFDFTGKSQIEQDVEEVHHPIKITVNDQAHANVTGTAIFLGLKVDANGVAFEGRSINVKSSTDSDILSTFESNIFKTGLAIVHATKPVLKPYTALTIAAITAILKRKENTQVHNFDLG